MPLNLGRDVGKNMEEVKEDMPEAPLKQRQAIALEGARKHGAHIPPPKGHHAKRKQAAQREALKR